MEFGVHFIDFLPGDPAELGPTLADAAKAAEQGGATLFTLADHFFQMENIGRAEDPFLEGYTSLGFLAATDDDDRVELAGHRGHLSLSGRAGQSRDHAGRAVAGPVDVGAGRGLVRPRACRPRHSVSAAEPRFEMLEETLQICRQMWSDNDGPYHGKHYQLAETICVPQPIRRPPILIGGDGEKKTLRLVAQYADIWNSMEHRRRRAQAQDRRAQPPLRHGGPGSR